MEQGRGRGVLLSMMPMRAQIAPHRIAPQQFVEWLGSMHECMHFHISRSC
jgi:truncated hemoglobin YjbI